MTMTTDNLRAERLALLKEYPHLDTTLRTLAHELTQLLAWPVTVNLAAQREALFADGQDCLAARTGYVITFVQQGGIAPHHQCGASQLDYLRAWWLCNIPEPLFAVSFTRLHSCGEEAL